MAAFNLTAELNLRGPSNLNQVVSNIRRQLSTVTLDLAINPTTSRGIQTITAEVRNLSAALRDAQTNAAALATALRGLGASIGNINTAAANLNTNLSGTVRNATTAGTAVRAASSEMSEFGRQAALAIRRFAAFSVATGSVYALTRAITSAYSEFINFNKEFTRLQQVTDTNASGLKSLANEITRLSTSLGVGSQELLNVSVTLAQAGLSAGETKTALEALAKSALAPSFDSLNDTVEGSIALMRQFSISASDLEGALGSINAVAAKFAVEAGDIIAAIQRTGGVFANASKGVSEGKDALNEFLAVFTSVRATTRESAETIATGLRTIFTRIQRASTIEALKQYGIALTDLEGKFVGPYEAVRRLSQGLKALDPRDLRFSQIVEELGGFRQIGKVIPLIQQFQVAQKALGVAQKGSTSLTADAAIAQEALSVRITKVREQFIGLIRDIGQSKGFQTFVDVSLKLASALISVADAAKNVLPAIAAITAIRGVGALGQFFSGFAGGIRRRAANGGRIQRFNNGGGVDVALMPGETIVDPQLVNSAGSARLRKINQADKLGRRQKFSRGGVAQVPGRGRTDSFYTTVPEGSFIVRTDATNFLGGPQGVLGAIKGKNKFGVGGKTHFSHLDAGPNVIDTKGRRRRYLGKGLSGIGIMMPAEWNLGWAQTGGDFGVSGQSIIDYVKATSNEQLFARQIGRKIGGRKHSGKTGSFRGGRKNPLYETFINSLDEIKNEIIKSIDPKFTYSKNADLYPLGRAMLRASGKASRELLRVRTIQTPEGGYEDISNEDMRKLFFGTNKDRDPQGMFSKAFYRKASGGIIQKFGIGGGPSRKGISLGARSKFKELDESELAKLSTADLIKYAKAQARDVFSTGGAGMAIANKFIEVPASKIIPELEPHLTTYLGKKGFWREQIAPFGKPIGKKSSKTKLNKENALKKQISRQADEVAARAQEWTSIKSGSTIDTYLSSKLEGPILADYMSAKSGKPLAKTFHNTRLRQAVNKALDDFDDFDYSAANIDKLVSGMAAERFAAGGEIPIVAQKGEYVINRESAKSIGYSNLDQLNKYHSGGVVGGFAAGGLPPRPGNPLPSNVVVPQTTLTALQQISEALERLGVSASDSALLLERGAGITIRASERAYQADVNRMRIAGASATDIYNAEQRLAQLREQNANKAITADVMRQTTGADLQDIQTRAEAQRRTLLNNRRSVFQQMGLSRDEIEERMADPQLQETIRRRSYANASGIPRGALNAYGIGGGDIEQYVNQSMMDTRTLRQMDAQLRQTREQELRNSAAYTSASSAEQRRMLRELRRTTSEEISERRNIIRTLRRDKGLSSGFLSTEVPNISTVGALFGMGQLRENAFGTSRTGRRTRLVEGINRFSGAAQQASMGLTFGAGIIGESLGKTIGGKEGNAFGAGASSFAGAVGVGAMFGPIGIFTGLILGASAAVKAYTEAIREATMQEQAQKIEGASVKLQKSFDSIGKASDRSGLMGALKDAGSRFEQIGEAENQRRKIIMSNTLDQQKSTQSFEDWISRLTFTKRATLGANLSQAEMEMTQSARQTGVLQTAPDLFQRGMAKGLTIKQIEATLKPGQLDKIREDYGVASGGLVASLVTRREEMRARGEDTSQIERTIKTVAERLFNKEVLDELRKREQAERTMATAMASATIRINLLAESLKKLSAASSKASALFQESKRKSQLAIGGAYGEPTNILQGANREQENILDNIQAYSVQEISGIINQIGSSYNLNPALTREAETAAVNQRILGEELPRILAEVSAKEGKGFTREGSSAMLIRKKLDEVLKTRVPDAANRNNVINQVLKTIEEKLQTRGGSVTVQDIAEDANVLKEIFGSSQEVLQVFNGLLKQGNDIFDELINATKEFATRLSAATEMRIQSQNIGIEANNQINQALGRGVGLSDMNAAFDNTILTLTQRIGANGAAIPGTGTMDPAVISARIKEKEDQARSIQEQMQKEQIGSARYKQLDEALKRTTLESLNLSKAHDKLANDSTRASNALSKINELRQVQENRQNSFLDLLKNVNNPEAMMQFTNEVGSFFAQMAGRGTTNNLPQAVAGLERQMAVLPQDQAAALKTQFIQKTMRMLQESGFTNMTPQLVELLIQNMGAGTQLNPEMRALVDEFYSYTEVQRDAVNQAADRTVAAATESARILIEGATKAAQTISSFGQTSPVSVMPAAPAASNATAHAKGGLIYASTGQFVNFQPKGTDTVPAMLTPGEFVVNARATKKNRGLLEAINSNNKAGGYSRGGVVYLEGGGYTPKDTTIEADAAKIQAEMDAVLAELRKQMAEINAILEPLVEQYRAIPEGPQNDPQRRALSEQLQPLYAQRGAVLSKREEVYTAFDAKFREIQERRSLEADRKTAATGELSIGQMQELDLNDIPGSGLALRFLNPEYTQEQMTQEERQQYAEYNAEVERRKQARIQSAKDRVAAADQSDKEDGAAVASPAEAMGQSPPSRSRSMETWTQRTIQQNNELVQQHRERNLLPGEPMEYANDEQKAYWEAKREKRQRFLAGNRFYAEQERQKQERQELERKEAVDYWNSQYPDGRRLPNVEFAVSMYRKYQRDKGAAARAEARQKERERIMFGAPVSDDDPDKPSKTQQAAAMTPEEMAKRKEEAKKLERGRQLATAHGQKPELVVGQSGYASELRYKDPDTGELTVDPIGYHSMPDQDRQALDFYRESQINRHNQAIRQKQKDEQTMAETARKEADEKRKAESAEISARAAASKKEYDDLKKAQRQERVEKLQATSHDLAAMTDKEREEYNARVEEADKKEAARRAEVDAIADKYKVRDQEMIASGAKEVSDEELSKYPEEIQRSYREARASKKAEIARKKKEKVTQLTKDDPESYNIDQFEHDPVALQEAKDRGISLQQLAWERNYKKIEEQIDDPSKTASETEALLDQAVAQINRSSNRIAQLQEAQANRGWVGHLGSWMTGSDPEGLEIDREKQYMAVAERLRSELYAAKTGKKVSNEQQIDANMRAREQLQGLTRSEAGTGSIQREAAEQQQVAIDLAQQAVTDTALTVGTLGAGSVATAGVRAVGGAAARIGTRQLLGNVATQGAGTMALRSGMASAGTIAAARGGVNEAINLASDTKEQSAGEFATRVAGSAVLEGAQGAYGAMVTAGIMPAVPKGAATMPTGPNLTQRAFEATGRGARTAAGGVRTAVGGVQKGVREVGRRLAENERRLERARIAAGRQRAAAEAREAAEAAREAAIQASINRVRSRTTPSGNAAVGQAAAQQGQTMNEAINELMSSGMTKQEALKRVVERAGQAAEATTQAAGATTQAVKTVAGKSGRPQMSPRTRSLTEKAGIPENQIDKIAKAAEEAAEKTQAAQVARDNATRASDAARKARGGTQTGVRTTHELTEDMGRITGEETQAAVKAVETARKNAGRVKQPKPLNLNQQLAEKAKKLLEKGKTSKSPDLDTSDLLLLAAYERQLASARSGLVKRGLVYASVGAVEGLGYSLGYSDPAYWDPARKQYMKKPQNDQYHENATHKARGGLIYASTGTLVPYQPRGTDTVPAMLTPGEFVINRKAAKQNMGLLKAINSGQNVSAIGFNKGGIVPTQYYADGVDGVPGSTSGGGVLSSIGVDTSSLDASFNNFNSSVGTLSSVIDSFVQGAQSIGDLSNAISSLGNIGLREGAGLMANAGTSVKEATTAFSAAMTEFNSAASSLSAAISKIPQNISLTVSGSIPIVVTVQLEGGTGANTDLSQIEQSIMNKVGLAINSATQGGVVIDTTMTA